MLVMPEAPKPLRAHIFPKDLRDLHESINERVCIDAQLANAESVYESTRAVTGLGKMIETPPVDGFIENTYHTADGLIVLTSLGRYIYQEINGSLVCISSPVAYGQEAKIEKAS